MAKDQRLELRVDTELREKLDALVGLRGVPASVVVRRAILDAHRHAFPEAVPVRPRLVVRDAARVIPEDAVDFHVALWGKPPSPAQVRFYAAYARGYVGNATDERIDAVITVALHIAPVRVQDPVALLVREELFGDVVRRVNAARLAAQDKPFADAVTATVERIGMGLPAAWWPTEPPVWVAIGLAVDERTPKWLRRRLLEAS